MVHPLGVALPIVQAPMAGSQGSALALAVTRAGGLGSLPAALLTVPQLRAELEAIRGASVRPVNVNFFCHQIPPPDEERERRWRATLAPYYRELDLDPAAIPEAAARVPFNAETATVLAEFEPPVVSFHFGLPDDNLLARVRSWGATILSSATTVAEARWLERRGVDVIIAQGVEAGGHRGMFLGDDLTTQVGTLALVRQVVGAVRVPVVAARGIADAEGVRAALALGAVAAQVGTAFLRCPEATTSAVHRAALAGAGAEHTALTNLFTGRPARGVVNRIIRELGAIHPAAPAFPLAATAMAPLRARAERVGSADFSPLWCGQNTSGCRAEPAGLVVRGLARVGETT